MDPDEEIKKMQRAFGYGRALIEEIYARADAVKVIKRAGEESFRDPFDFKPLFRIVEVETPEPRGINFNDLKRAYEDLPKALNFGPYDYIPPLPTPAEDRMKYPKPGIIPPPPKVPDDGIITCPTCRRLRHVADPHDCEVKKKR